MYSGYCICFDPPTSLTGFDFITTALRHTLLHILSSPTARARLLAELRTLPYPPDSTVSEITIDHLPCLRAYILESLRLFPLLTPYLPKCCPAASATLPDGTHIPGGMEVAVSFVALQRDRSVYGGDVECFRPERGVMERQVGLVFMSGRYQCLGKNLALLEVGKVVGELVRRFEMSVVDHAEV